MYEYPPQVGRDLVNASVKKNFRLEQKMFLEVYMCADKPSDTIFTYRHRTSDFIRDQEYLLAMRHIDALAPRWDKLWIVKNISLHMDAGKMDVIIWCRNEWLRPFLSICIADNLQFTQKCSDPFQEVVVEILHYFAFLQKMIWKSIEGSNKKALSSLDMVSAVFHIFGTVNVGHELQHIVHLSYFLRRICFWKRKQSI